MIMCTLALHFREFSAWPLIVAANRDEYFNRPSAAPLILTETPRVLGGKDLVAGGTWLGVNEYGLLVGILNRRSAQEGTPCGARSRGLLCLDLLRCKDPDGALRLLSQQDASNYQPFNLLFADEKEAYAAYNQGKEIRSIQLDQGLHVFSNTAFYDPRSEKMDRAYLLFSSLRDKLGRDPRASASRISDFKEALSDHVLSENSGGPKDAICVHSPSYGTVSSSLIFYASAERRFVTYFSPGPPCRSDFGQPIALEVR